MADASAGEEATTKRELTPLERLADLTRRIAAVPRAEIDVKERAWKRRRSKVKRHRPSA